MNAPKKEQGDVKMDPTFPEKIERFRKLFEDELAQRRKIDYPSLMPEFVTLKNGRKYVNVDIDGCGRYMVVKETQEIFGIKSYGVIHRGHFYGTLDTIDQWDWSHYVGRQKGGN